LKDDYQNLSRALHLPTVFRPPTLGRLLLDGTINAFRDLLGYSRAKVPPHGTIRFHYQIAGQSGDGLAPPWLVRRWFRRFSPVLAAAARLVYVNDDTPLEKKLPAAINLLVRQINLVDLLAVGSIGLATLVWSAVQSGWDRLLGMFRRRRRPRQPRLGLYAGYARAVRQTTDMTPVVAG